ncbi:MAG: hypothetical protein J6C85_05195 [Alphaproteobacteria bacterium]|nr:hypothetical protein [Alphaproteobacteria bacterium]
MEKLIKTIGRNNGCSENMAQYIGQRFDNVLTDVPAEQRKMIPSFLMTVNAMIEKNKDNPYFAALCQSEMTLDTAFKLEQQKTKQADKPVLNMEDLNKMAESGGFGYYPIVSELEKVTKFAEKYDDSGKLKKSLEKDVCLQEFGALGLKLGKEIKENQHNEFYKEAKENAGFERKRRQDFEKVKAMLMATADCGKV